eukprot:CAMPEP_0184695052 /NCGR_PEP_ID=MMETSP0313-20130426/2808_1 /TAXON_ID=2792 /ORGANISM="Porphyridium aerugineum, Strain SAG 1380-2" /LENGTH=236 /DNA_ID=CAMNT_0027153439 /DNA_START=156 /DNA_END=866 /DNA_ORIENTATION=-
MTMHGDAMSPIINNSVPNHSATTAGVRADKNHNHNHNHNHNSNNSNNQKQNQEPPISVAAELSDANTTAHKTVPTSASASTSTPPPAPQVASDPENRKKGQSNAHNERKDTLWIRKFLAPSRHNLFVNDVVVLLDPRDARRKYVRRIVAMEGEELINTKDTKEVYTLPEDTCWVLCENKSATQPDSRYFGPVRLDKIIGRVIFAVRSATEYSRVRNSDMGMLMDEIVLAVEQPKLV